MSQTISRKYRPQKFENVVGQNHVKITLQNEIVSGQIAHAYLFTGPRGIGKTTLSRLLAKSLNCNNRKENEHEPCNKCSSCQQINKDKSLDIIEIDAATHTQVDKVRENIIENIKFPPHEKYKVFIIDEVHMLSTAAFNALLKTLEEPPEYAVFILCTTESYKVPETIISRCQRFDFKKVSADLLSERLKKIVAGEKIKIDDDVIFTIALRSGGFIRDAESMLGQIMALLGKNKKEIKMEDVSAILPRSDLHSITELIDALINKNTTLGVEIINKLVSDGVDLERFNLDLIDYLRKLILVKISLKDKDANIAALPQEIKEKLVAQAEVLELDLITHMIEIFSKQQEALKQAEVIQLPLEIAVIKIVNSTNKTQPAFASTPTTQASADKQDKKKLQINEDEPAFVPKGTTAGEQTTSKKIPVKSEDKKEENNESPVVSRKLSTDMKKIKEIWPTVLQKSVEHNNSLPLILKSCFPYKIEEDVLILAFGFDIHAKRLQDIKCSSELEKILIEILGEKIRVRSQVIDHQEIEKLKQEFKPPAPPEIDDSQLQELADSFGGKLV